MTPKTRPQNTAPKKNKHCPTQGITLTEYGILFSFLGLLCVAGMNLLGTSTANLFQNTSHTLTGNNGTLSLLQTPNKMTLPVDDNSVDSTPKSATVVLQGSGYYSITTDPATGQPTIELVKGATGVNTNVSSIDGGRMNTLGSIMLAQSLSELADKQTDPVLKEYFSEMAKQGFYLGGAEAELDDIPPLDESSTRYTNGDALHDIVSFNKQLATLINNPPPQLSADAFNEAMPLVTSIYNIANNYQNTLARFIQKDGSVNNFGNPATYSSGTGEPGSVLTMPNLKDDQAAVGSSYKQLRTLSEMKALSAQLLKDQNVASVPVRSTLTNATELDQKASETTEVKSTTSQPL